MEKLIISENDHCNPGAELSGVEELRRKHDFLN